MKAPENSEPLGPRISGRRERVRLRPTGNPPAQASDFHGRRKGKALRPGQVRLVEDVLPKLAIDLAAARTPDRLFPREIADLRLEIGFGGGEHLAAEAVRCRSTGFIGCEPFVNGVAKAIQMLADAGVDNVRIHAGEARPLIDALPEACLGGVDVLYPDPWPKWRHRKRRLISQAMLARLARVMRSGAELHFATDIDDYAGWTLARIARSVDFVWDASRAADWETPWSGFAPTRYEAKARAQGRVPVYLTFVRR